MSAIRKLKTPSTQCNTQPWRLGSSSFHRDRGTPVMVPCDPFLLSLHSSRGKGFKSSLCQHAAPSVLAMLEPRRAFAQEFSEAVCGWWSTHGVRRRPQVSCHSRSCSWAPCSAHSESSPPNVSQAYLLVACMCKLQSFSLLSHSLYTLAYIAISLTDEGKRYQNVYILYISLLRFSMICEQNWWTQYLNDIAWPNVLAFCVPCPSHSVISLRHQWWKLVLPIISADAWPGVSSSEE
jgi:hypothetical protein